MGILAQDGHLLVEGGPGSGKTTIALLKAKARTKTLRPGQRILFLSFSRAAIRQVLLRCRELLTSEERSFIEVQTYHAFCMWVLRSHGRLLHGHPLHWLYPREERLRKSNFEGNWLEESHRLAQDEGIYIFDLFASGAASLLEGSQAVRELISDRYPMIVVDEFQDTDEDQWRLVQQFSHASDIFCLADPDQRIFDYRANVDPRRVKLLIERLAPTIFDLGGDNHRSPNAGILGFADAILHNRAPLPQSRDVKLHHYRPNTFQTSVHAAVMWTFSELRRRDVVSPTVAVLARSNALVAELSEIISHPHTYNGQELSPLTHSVVWDAELSAAAALVVASILEWPCSPDASGLNRTLIAVSNYYKLKHAEEQTQTAWRKAGQFAEAAAKVTQGQSPRILAGRQLEQSYRVPLILKGDPVGDWKLARAVISGIDALSDISRDVRLIPLFRASATLGGSLADRWLNQGSYLGVSRLVRRALDQDKLSAAERDPQGCMLMNIHKAKGKEFDGVVLVEGAFKGAFLDERTEQEPFERSRRLLRVGITRARSLVTLVRPHQSRPLVD
ncbi:MULTISPECIES: UvrD-helicase domain-containing protein [Stenotrophomonas maltophilia group]|uniref:UvrD-helicase domain-containing protein n=1 Tax=Stenotrophomonas maltophilia group TaxID=995085 RepID=UPI001E2E2177|nr:ATP-dependent helicase [Stenotrophomonas maltophilia]UGB47781.1 ATP-dependent helicase [Stenotrophomonas maltophilia]